MTVMAATFRLRGKLYKGHGSPMCDWAGAFRPFGILLKLVQAMLATKVKSLTTVGCLERGRFVDLHPADRINSHRIAFRKTSPSLKRGRKSKLGANTGRKLQILSRLTLTFDAATTAMDSTIADESKNWLPHAADFLIGCDFCEHGSASEKIGTAKEKRNSRFFFAFAIHPLLNFAQRAMP